MASIRFGIERQPVEKGRRGAGGLRLGHVLGVGGQDSRARTADGLGHGGERAVLLRRRRKRERTGGLARLAADVAHRGFELAGVSDRLERGVHGLDPSCVQRLPTMFGEARRGGSDGGVVHTAPQRFAAPVTEIAEPRRRRSRFVSGIRTKERVMGLPHIPSAKPAAAAVPGRRQIRGRGTRRREADLRVIARYVVLPERAADQCSAPIFPCRHRARAAVPPPRPQSHPSQGPMRAAIGKKFAARRGTSRRPPR